MTGNKKGNGSGTFHFRSLARSVALFVCSLALFVRSFARSLCSFERFFRSIVRSIVRSFLPHFVVSRVGSDPVLLVHRSLYEQLLTDRVPACH